MGRRLMRVPLDFDYPIGQVWEGYSPRVSTFKRLFSDSIPFIKNMDVHANVCEECGKHNECREQAPYCVWYNQDLKKQWYREVPKGEGYQLWETTTEGSPVSPVFKTLDELCGWCEENATTFADMKASKEEWKEMLSGGLVKAVRGNFTFI